MREEAPSSPQLSLLGILLAEPEPSYQDLCRGAYAQVEVAVGTRLRDSWRVIWNRRDGAIQVKVPPVLGNAPASIKQAVLDWALLMTRRGLRTNPGLKSLRRRLESSIRSFLHAQADPGAGGRPSHERLRQLARNRRRLLGLRPAGRFHDLETTFAQVNTRYFGSGLEARITWSTRLGGQSTHTIAHDGEGRPYHLLTISRGYDNPEVTPEILGGVVYHECLHIAIPPREECGRRVVHGPDFRKREREYDHFAAWWKWHREGLPKALRRLRRSSLLSMLRSSQQGRSSQ